MDADELTKPLEDMEDQGAFSNPAPNWDRYEISGFLGEGAMGRVYRAFDRQLQRPVALKFMRSDDPDQVARFLREAQSQARIEHENVCRVYEVGEVDGKAYIAMRFIDGKSLRDLAPELSLEQKVCVMEKVAEAAQAAHSMGVIHRDLKPANVMVEVEDNGELHPYVLDFGIAREISSPSMTMTGVVVGTPAFMAPEQVRGGSEDIDRRVDVYALGASLYYVIAGTAPFGGTTRMETMLRVLEDTAKPLRQVNNRVPIDLETIVATCLEKEPHRRYDSARALAKDLGRYLAGEPIEARRAGLFYRLGKRMLKHRTLTAVVALATAVVIALSGALIYQRAQANRRQALAQRFGQELERIDGMLRQAHLLPLHNVTEVRDEIRDRMTQIEESMERAGSAGLGPGSFALGVGHMELGELKSARDRLQASWDSGHRSEEVEGALGRVLAGMYLEASEAADRIRNTDLRVAQREEIETTLLQPALTHLRRGQAMNEDMDLHQEALIALLEKRFEDALDAARRSYEKNPWLYESMRLEAEILVSRGKERDEGGQVDAARADYEAAGRLYQRAIAIGRSDVALYLGEADRLIRSFYLDLQEGVLDEEVFLRAMDMIDSADIAQSDNVQAFNLRSKAHWLRGEYEIRRGIDPTKSLETAIEMASTANVLEAENAQVYINLGMIYRLQASYERRQGRDPRPALELAIANNHRALEIDGDSAVAWINLGTANYLVAAYLLSSGLDPMESLQQAADGYQESIRVRPTFAAHSNSGLVHWQRAKYQRRHGQDPEESLEAAARCFERAIEFNPTQGQVHSNRGLILLERAEWEIETGGDPSPWVERSLMVLRRAVELMPSLAAAHNNLGNALKMRAIGEMSAGRDPLTVFEDAVASYSQAIALDPSLAYQFNNLGDTWGSRAQYEVQIGEDPYPSLREARANLQRALEMDPTLAFARYNLALSSHTEARYLTKLDRNPLDVIERGRREAGVAVENNPNHWDLHLMRGRLELAAVEWSIEHGGDTQTYLESAGLFFSAAEELNPGLPEILLHRARSEVFQALWKIRQNKNPRDDLAEALSLAEKGLKIDPNDADFLFVKGRLYLIEAQIADNHSAKRAAALEAVDLLETAQGTKPFLKPLCTPLIAEANEVAG